VIQTKEQGAGGNGTGPDMLRRMQLAVNGSGPAPTPVFNGRLAGYAYQFLIDQVEDHTAVVGVIGLGYVGLPLGMVFAERGFRVIGFDISERVVNRLNAGDSHIQDVPSVRLNAFIGEGLFSATADMSRLRDCDVIIVCVPTPLSKTRDPDVSYMQSAAESMAAALRPGQLVVLESTTYPGTTRELLLPLLERGGLRVGEDFFLCFSPERVDPGNGVWHTRNTPKVIGGVTARCLAAGLAVYGRGLDALVPVSSPEVAEMTKLLENTFRSVNIALVNEMAVASERLGVNVWEVIDAAATKPFGYMKFLPGPGIGGHCIPLDPYYLSWKLRTLDFRMRLVDAAGEINREMPAYVAQKVCEALNARRKPVHRSRVLVLGVAYKPDIDDVRESPALEIIRTLEQLGADVRYHDPHVHAFTEHGVTQHSVELSEDELAAADCVLIVTGHSGIDYESVVARSSLVLDTRNVTAGMKAAHVVSLSEKPALMPDLIGAQRSMSQSVAV
jgi:UDP-N-acetyl-D-glucosamine dehydrogenase